MDRHNPQSALPGQPLQREGTYLAQLSWEHNYQSTPISDAKVSIGYLPRFYLSKHGLPSNNVNIIQFDETRPLNESIYKSSTSWSTSHDGVFLRLYGNVYSGDANLVLYRMESQNQWGLSYGRYVMPWLELHGESLYYSKPHYTLLSNESSHNGFLDYLLGARFEYDQDLGVTVEYLNQAEQPDKFPSDEKLQRALIVRVLNPFSHRLLITPLRRYMMTSLYARNLRDIYSVTCNIIYGVAQQDAMASIRGEMKVASHALVAVTGSVIAGSASSFYGAAIPNDYRVTSEVEVVF